MGYIEFKYFLNSVRQLIYFHTTASKYSHLTTHNKNCVKKEKVYDLVKT